MRLRSPVNRIIRWNEKTKTISEDSVTGGFEDLFKHPRRNGGCSLRDKMYLS